MKSMDLIDCTHWMEFSSTELYDRRLPAREWHFHALIPKHRCDHLIAFIHQKAYSYTMSKPFDYSKWDNIELSDDEDDVHPNIDRESWFRMKHRSRVEREEHEDKDKKRIMDEVRNHVYFILHACLCRI